MARAHGVSGGQLHGGWLVKAKMGRPGLGEATGDSGADGAAPWRRRHEQCGRIGRWRRRPPVEDGASIGSAPTRGSCRAAQGDQGGAEVVGQQRRCQERWWPRRRSSRKKVGGDGGRSRTHCDALRWQETHRRGRLAAQRGCRVGERARVRRGRVSAHQRGAAQAWASTAQRTRGQAARSCAWGTDSGHMAHRGLSVHPGHKLGNVSHGGEVGSSGAQIRCYFCN